MGHELVVIAIEVGDAVNSKVEGENPVSKAKVEATKLIPVPMPDKSSNG